MLSSITRCNFRPRYNPSKDGQLSASRFQCWVVPKRVWKELVLHNQVHDAEQRGDARAMAGKHSCEAGGEDEGDVLCQGGCRDVVEEEEDADESETDDPDEFILYQPLSLARAENDSSRATRIYKAWGNKEVAKERQLREVSDACTPRLAVF